MFGSTVLRRIFGLKREELKGLIISLIKYRKMRCMSSTHEREIHKDSSRKM